MAFLTVTQNNTTRVIPFFMVLSSDHITGATGKSPALKISKNGGAGVTPAGAITEIDATNLPGWYQIAANATDANTLGSLALHATATACDPADYVYDVVAINRDDTVRLGLTALPNVASGSAGAIPTTGTGANQITVASGQVTVGTNNDKTGYGLSAAAVQAVWDALTSALTTVGSIGKLLVDNINATISSRLASASISLAAGAVTVGTNNDKTGYTVSTVSDKTGYSLTTLESNVLASGTAGTSGASTITLTGASASDDVYKGAVIKIYSGTGSGQTRVGTGYVGATKVLTTDSPWAIVPDGTSLWAVLDERVPKLNTSLEVIAASVTGDVSGNLTGTVGDLTATAKASVKTQVVNALTVDTYAEPSGAVAATATLKDMLNWLKVLSRNKITQTSTTQTLRNDGDAATISTSTASDDSTTFTRGKWA